TNPTAAAFEASGEYPLRERSLVVLVTRKPEDKGQIVTSTEARSALTGAKGSGSAPPGPSPI
ncbi:MAG TPA: hypothetical protein VHS97_25225, partial [Isosphaeraceae bacterium]|nr:hypothetical protein [Isosphaeraceae bacterium]